MKHAILITLALLPSLLSAALPGQNTIQKKADGNGSIQEDFTLSPGQIIGRTAAGTLGGFTLGSGFTLTGTNLSVTAGGSFSTITGVPADNAALQAALDGKLNNAAAAAFQPVDSDLIAIAALTTTTTGRSLLAAADASALRGILGLGTLATQSGSLSDYLLTATAATTYQPLDADLTSIAALTTTTTGRSLLAAADAAALRTIMGLGTLVATAGGVISTGGSNTLTLGTDPRLTQANSGRPIELNTFGGTVNIFDTSVTGPRIGLSKTAGNTNPDLTISYTATRRLGIGTPVASGWLDQHIGPAGGIVGSTTNASPTNDLYITNATTTGTGSSTSSDIIFATYGTNGTSGTAIGTITERLKINTNGVTFGGAGLVGPWTSLSSALAVHNAALTGATDYALLQLAGGDTYLNAASGRDLNLCIGNVPIGTLKSTGLQFGFGGGIGLNSSVPLTCGIYALGGTNWICRGGMIYFQAPGGGGQPMLIDTTNNLVTATNLKADKGMFAWEPANNSNTGATVLCIGDSITLGTTGTTTPYPTLLSVPTWNSFTPSVVNLGKNSYTVALHWNEAGTTIIPQINTRTSLNVAIVWLGTNDVTLGGLTPAQAYSQLRAFCGYLKRHGLKVIVCEMISRQNATADGYKNAFNALLVANHAKFADGFVSMPASIKDDGAYAGANFADTIHLNNAGQAIAAGAIDAVLDDLINNH